MCTVAAALSEADIAAMADALSKKPFVRAKQTADAAKAAHGKQIQDANCTKCHTEGGSSADDDAGILAGQWMQYIHHTFEEFKSGQRPLPKKMKPKFDALTRGRHGRAGKLLRQHQVGSRHGRAPSRHSKPESRWQRLWRKPRSRWLLGIPIGGFLLFGVGIVGWASFDATLHYTNSFEFCTSCHEMRDSMLPEYVNSVHGKNTAGVRAICSDCHVPRAFIPKMGAKLAATVNELPKWAMGPCARGRNSKPRASRWRRRCSPR